MGTRSHSSLGLSSTWAQARSLIRFSQPHRKRLYLTFAFVIGVGLWEALVVSAALPVIDSIVNRGDSSANAPTGYFGWVFDIYTDLPESTRATLGVVVLMGLESVRNILAYVVLIAETTTATAIIVARRATMLNNLMSARLSFYDRHRSGDLFQTVSGEMVILEAGIRSLVGLVSASTRAAVTLAVMIILSWKLVLVLFAFLVANGVATYVAGRKIQRTSEVALAGRAALMTDLNEAAGAIRQHKSLGSERRAAERMAGFSSMAEWRMRKQRLLIFVLNPISTGIGLIAIAVILVISIESNVFDAGGADVAALLLFLFLVVRLAPVVSNISNHYASLKGAGPSLAKVEKILYFDSEDLETGGGEKPEKLITSEVAFNNITFAYDSDPPAIRDINLRIGIGSTVAVVGESGSGKSTLVDLLPRFYEPQKGTIAYDGLDAAKIDLHHLRERIGIVSQGIVLFADSIEENIRAARPDATHEQVREAARQAYAHDFVEALPDGYQTVLGERGVTLSEGQRQRIAIAQAFLKDPELLILDEATSALDSESESHIQAALDELSEGRTVVIVAHRLSTIRNADTIVVLRDGKIVETGSWKELIAAKNEFWRMCQSQGIMNTDGDTPRAPGSGTGNR